MPGLRDTDRVAEALADAYEKRFGRRSRGKFIIQRDHLKILLGRKILKQKVVDALYSDCLDLDYVLIDLDGVFVLLDLDLVSKWRCVPHSLVMKLNDEINEEEEEEYEDMEPPEDDEDEENDWEEEDDEEEDEEEDRGRSYRKKN